MKMLRYLLPVLLVLNTSCKKTNNSSDPTPPSAPTSEYTVVSNDGTIVCPFGNLSYRVFYPKELNGTTYVIHVSRGGNGNGDDRSQLLPYVEAFVKKGYIVIQIDHRSAGSDVNLIAQYRGEEIKCIAGAVSNGNISYGSFSGTVDGSKQGFAGHSGGCMEGLESVGTDMTHGNYLVPEIKALYGMSPAGYSPDQFGIKPAASGFGAIGTAAVFVIVGEQEKDVNGTGGFMSTDWRLQAYSAMSISAPRFQAFAKGNGTAHNDISLDNTIIQKYNIDNALALFDTYVKGTDRKSEIGTLSIPPNNPIVFSTKGL